MKPELPNYLLRDDPRSLRRGAGRAGGFGLIEVIAILAVILILALAITPRFIRQMDYQARLKESATLQTFNDALKRSILRTRYIPDQTGWATRVKDDLGLELSQVTTNPRGGQRVYLIDPEQQVGVWGGALPYTQPAWGSVVSQIITVPPTVLPPHVRVMILSSLSTPLPAQIVPGVAAASGDYSFANIWGTAEGQIPMGWTWSGQPDDLKIERIDLDGLFVKITFYNNDYLTTAPYFSVDGLALQSLPNSVYIAHFIQTTHLNLHKADQSIEYSELLQRSTTFTFRVGTWRGDSLSLGNFQPGPSDLQRAVNLFMRAPLNPYTKFGTTQRQVYDAMVNYMSNFVVWRTAGYPSLGSGAPLLNSQVDLGDETTFIINKQ